MPSIPAPAKGRVLSGDRAPPVGIAEQIRLADAVDHLGQDPAVPAARGTAAADPILGVPAAAVDLPGRPRFAADLGDEVAQHDHLAGAPI